MKEFDWLGYLELAVNLSTQDDDASQRTAVSRAYYYAYHLALARAETNGYIPPRQAGSHRDLWLLYDASPIMECRHLADIGQRLMEWRVQADYRDSFPALDKTVHVATATAEKFANLLARVDTRHPKQASHRQ